MIWRKAESSFDVVVFNRCLPSPWIRLLFSRTTRRRTVQMSPSNNPIIRDILLREIPRPENQTIFSIITGRILVGLNAILVWDCYLHTATAQSWMWVYNLGQLETSAHPRKKADCDWTKVMTDHKSFQRVDRGLLNVFKCLILVLR